MWEIIILIISICLFLLWGKQKEIEKQHTITQKLLTAIIFALYDKRKSEKGERLLDIADIEEAIKVVSAQKRPEKDTPHEDLEKILGEDYIWWRRQMRHKDIRESLNTESSRKQ